MGVFPFPMPFSGPPKFGSFSPLALFAASEPGVWYDPSDMTTLFQDAAGTTPVTAVEQPVGLMLDKSKGLVLGNELVTNGGFDSATGWTLSSDWSISAGALRCTAATSFTNSFQLIPIAEGKYYRITVNLTISGGTWRVYLGNGLPNNSYIDFTTSGAQSFVLVAPAGTPAIYIQNRNNGGQTLVADNISVRELPGSHASQSTAASRPVLSARYNLLTYTEQFDNAAWTKRSTNSGVTADATTGPFGGSTADEIYSIGAVTDTNVGVYQELTKSAASIEYKYVAWVKRKNLDYFSPGISSTSGANGVFCRFNIASGVPEVSPTTFGTGFTVGTASITSVGSGWYFVTLTGTTDTATSLRYTANFTKLANAGSTSYAIGDGGYIWGADLRVSNDGVGLPAYQRVGAAVTGTSGTISPPVAAVTGVPDYDTTGFPMYLRFDGTDDSLSSGSIDFTGTDKMSVFAGVRKLNAMGTASVLAELSAAIDTNNGSFIIPAPGGATQYAFGSKGTVASYANTTSSTYAAPVTNVLTGTTNISADSAVLRANGVEVGTSATDQGTGNFGNYPMFVGSRNNASLRFNGHLYSLIIRGALTDAATIASTETWVNQRTKAF